MPTVSLPDRPSPFTFGIIVELIFLCGTFITGLVIAGAVGVTQARWNGKCILSMGVTCTMGTDLKWHYSFTSDGGLCHFCLNFQIACVLTSFVFAIYRILVLCYRKYNIAILRLVTAGIFTVYALLVLAEAAIITIGLNAFCDGLMNSCGVSFGKTCPQYQTWIDWIYDDGSSFYSTTLVAEVAAWISFVFWVALAVWSFVLFLKARRANRQMVLPPSSLTTPAAAAAPSTVTNKPV
ncbi:transmembrane protein 179B-like [Patiria miniata]|uniref:Transmembrane protein n=1 Tax=Patiria miniata TaxID=46514 RepID=A0A913ZVJ7_PATMI|nr:transmembrane protein 179B-like [Patiria miniata]